MTEAATEQKTKVARTEANKRKPKVGGKRAIGAANPLSPRRVQAAIKTARALQLRIQGFSNEEIAEQLGLKNQAQVPVMLGRALEKVKEVPAKQYRDILLARLDKAIVAIMPEVEEGNLRAIETLLRIEERRAKLLGLDGAIKLEDVTGQKKGKAEEDPDKVSNIMELLGRVGALPGIESGDSGFGGGYELGEDDVADSELDPIAAEHYGADQVEMPDGSIVIRPRRTA